MDSDGWIRVTIQGLKKWFDRWGEPIKAVPYRLLTGPDGRQWQLRIKNRIAIRELPNQERIETE